MLTWVAGAKIFQWIHISCTWLLQILHFVIEEIVQIAENPKYIFLSNWELILTSWLKLNHPQEDSGGKFIMIEGRDLSGLQNYSPYWEVQSNKTNNFVDCLNEINFHSRGVLLQAYSMSRKSSNMFYPLADMQKSLNPVWKRWNTSTRWHKGHQKTYEGEKMASFVDVLGNWGWWAFSILE